MRGAELQEALDAPHGEGAGMRTRISPRVPRSVSRPRKNRRGAIRLLAHRGGCGTVYLARQPQPHSTQHTGVEHGREPVRGRPDLRGLPAGCQVSKDKPLAWGTRVRVKATDQRGYVQLHYAADDRYFVRHGIGYTGVYALHELEVIK